MSTESGKNNILNPEGHIPIDEINWFYNDFSKEIKMRVDLYVENYLQSDAVLDRFENIKLEIISFSYKAASRIDEMENEWTDNASLFQGSESNALTSIGMFTVGFVITSLIVFGLGFSVVVAAAWGVMLGVMNIGLRTSSEIKNEYESCKKAVCKELCSHLENGYGLITKKIIEKVTDDIIPKRIESLRMLISQTSAKRDIYIANRQSLTYLNGILEKMMEKLTKLEKEVNT